MKSDLDRLMTERGFDAILIVGEAKENHALTYLTSRAKVSHAIVLKKRGDAPVIICNPMERDEAAKSGLQTLTTTDFDYPKLLKEARSYFEAEIQLHVAILQRFEVGGTLSFYGLMDPGQAFVMLTEIGKRLPHITVTGETETTIFDEAYTTKDSTEIAAMKTVAERANTVMGEVVAFLKSHTVRDNWLIRDGGQPLTVKDVKQYLRERLLHYELEDGGETIFAIGRDAAVPHSRGEDGDHLELGKTIIFDLFPRQIGGGYFHDMTRTFCLGYAPDEVKAAYDQVMYAFHQVIEAMTIGQKAGDLQKLTCDIFEKFGHPTPISHPGTTEGYVHGVGHGMGLQIHARPRLSVHADDTIQAGQVITIEPGLYYPDQGYGVRIEDTVYVETDGTIHSISPYPKDLVIPVGDET